MGRGYSEVWYEDRGSTQGCCLDGMFTEKVDDDDSSRAKEVVCRCREVKD